MLFASNDLSMEALSMEARFPSAIFPWNLFSRSIFNMRVSIFIHLFTFGQGLARFQSFFHGLHGSSSHLLIS